MSLRLDELIEGLPVSGLEPGRGEVEVTGVAHDSRKVGPGDLFVAITGAAFDGREYAAQAVADGAVAVVASGPPPDPEAVARGGAVPWLTTEEPRRVMASLAARAYGRPDREMVMVGATGTNGKSTVTTLLKPLLKAAGLPAGLFGSLVYSFGDWTEASHRTTPESADLFRMLREMRDHGARAAVMEVSSHALALGRVDEVLYDVGIFTNLSRDHFDFHKDFEDYYQAKRTLFDRLKPEGKAVVCTDDEHGRRLAAELRETLGPERVLTYGDEGDVAPRDVKLSPKGTRIAFETPEGRHEAHAQLLGRFNVPNMAAVVATSQALGLGWEPARRVLETMEPLPGRMEPVRKGQPFPVYIDYSHTPASLEAALNAVKEMTGGQVIVVFGCGGDRDKGKRPQMGKIAGDLADLPIVTSDNPRTEDPMQIIADVEAGLKESGNPRYRVVPDRREAIRRAISVAAPGWAVLIAGKGNEPVQIIGDRHERFFDYDEAKAAIEELFRADDAG